MPDSNVTIPGLLSEIDRHDDELDRLRGEYMAACKPSHESIREILKEARESGVNMRAFRIVLKGHRFERKQLAAIDELDGEEADAHAEMLEALGEFADTPLGAAAVAGTKPRRRREDSLDSLRPS